MLRVFCGLELDERFIVVFGMPPNQSIPISADLISRNTGPPFKIKLDATANDA